MDASEWNGTVSADTSAGTVISLYCKGGSNLVTSIEELLALVADAPTDGTQWVINVNADITFEDASGSASSTVHLTAGQNILIQSHGNNIFTLTYPGGIMFDPGWYVADDAAMTYLTLENLKLVGGYNTLVRGYRSRCKVTLNNCTLSSNQARGCDDYRYRGGGQGGAIRNYGGAVTLTNCVLSNNTAATNTKGVGQGGAIYNNGGTTSLTGCTLTGNTAESGNAIYCASGTVTLTSCSTLNEGDVAKAEGATVTINGRS